MPSVQTAREQGLTFRIGGENAGGDEAGKDPFCHFAALLCRAPKSVRRRKCKGGGALCKAEASSVCMNTIQQHKPEPSQTSVCL